jgi:hypothetical protein
MSVLSTTIPHINGNGSKRMPNRSIGGASERYLTGLPTSLSLRGLTGL